jgi:hypothetical protein
LSEDEKKKKYYYYYGGKEKKAGEIKKAEPEGELYPFQRDFDNMMQRFQRAFDDFWVTPPARWGHGFRHHHVFPPMMLPSVDLEDQGKAYRLTVDLPGYKPRRLCQRKKRKRITCAKKGHHRRIIDVCLCQKWWFPTMQKHA